MGVDTEQDLLNHLNIKLTELTPEQEKYSRINKKGPFKPDHYKY